MQKVISSFFSHDYIWLRIFGHLVFHAQHSNIRPLFSERKGFRKYYKIPFTQYRIRFGK